MSPPRDYVIGKEPNQIREKEREREWDESSAVKEEEFGCRFIVELL
jgi:hypothetical protein